MLSGLLFTVAYIVYFKFINPAASNPDNWWLGISPEGIGVMGMLINFAVAFTVSRFNRARTPEHVKALVDDVRIPSGAGVAHRH